MACIKCGKDLPPGAAFCPACGKRQQKPKRKTKSRGNGLGSVYKLPNGKTVNVIGEGRLVNIAAADGHPAEIMDLSFAVQAMSAMYIRDNHDKLENRVIDVSAEIDDIIARRKLDAWGVKIDELTQEQKKYLSSWEV